LEAAAVLRGDLEAAVEFYESNATFVWSPAKSLRGTSPSVRSSRVI
jgi:hypothetical protein